VSILDCLQDWLEQTVTDRVSVHLTKLLAE